MANGHESEEYELTDCRVPIDGCIGTDEEILQDIEDYSDGEFLVADMEVMELIMLTPSELEAKEMEAFQAGCNAAVKHCDENGFGPTTDDMYRWKEGRLAQPVTDCNEMDNHVPDAGKMVPADEMEGIM